VKKITILVVDDEPIVLDSCRCVLEAEGFDVHIAPNADKAIEAIQRKVYNLILIDVKMPEKNGIYLTRKVKEKFPEIPIVIMSGYSTPETIASCKEIGVDRFIAKPFIPDELLETVRQLI